MSQQDPRRITHQFLNAVRIEEYGRFGQFVVPLLLLIGVLYTALQVVKGDWLQVAVSAIGIVLLLVLASFWPLQRRLLGEPFAAHHAITIAFFWVYSLIWLWAFRLLSTTPSLGKDSRFFYIVLIILFALTFRALQLLFALTSYGGRLFIVHNHLWEQILVAINELISMAVLGYVLGGLLAQLVQPDVFTLRVDSTYVVGLVFVAVLYYLGMQAMWVQHWYNWLELNHIWVRFARLLAPLVLIVSFMVVLRRFTRLSDPRTANLLGGAAADRAVLALSPIIWIGIITVIFLVYTGRRGLRQRFLPDDLLEHLPPRIANVFNTISDMDMLLVLGVFSMSIPLQLFLLDDEKIGVIDTLRQQIALRGNALLESSEQALALIFAIPFYVLLLGLMILYAYILMDRNLHARDRDDLVAKLPVGMVIILIITLYLGAIPFSQVLVEGRLPQLPQDLGRILVFYVLIPLVLLYFHYFVFVRAPYGFGQNRWRALEEDRLKNAESTIEGEIAALDGELARLEGFWNTARGRFAKSDADYSTRFDALYRFIELNGKRDKLNMARLRIVADKQELAEVSEAPISLAVARLPLRVVSIGIPLLLAINIYQWAVLNDGLREIANNPNITIVEFFRIVLQQTQF